MTAFTTRSNTRRAAKRMIETGQAPASEFDIEPVSEGGFKIVWKTPLTPAEFVETPQAQAPDADEIAAAAEDDDAPHDDDADANLDAVLLPVETARLIAELERRGYRTTRRLVRQRRTTTTTPRERQPSKAQLADAAAARGVMPEKPIVTSPTNQRYQKRFDRLAELAGAGDWDAIAAYEVRGNNTYAKDVARYRDRLLAAHAAQAAQNATE